MITIDIWSDFACPFCWIGKHRLQAALAQLGPAFGPVSVRWRAFQLDPEASSEPVPLRQAYAAKFGGPERTEQLLATVQAQARADGLAMDFGQGQVKVNTLQAHRLLQLAAAEGDVQAVSEALFQAHFAHGRNLADLQVLTEAGMAGGLSAARIAHWLAGEQGLPQLRAELAQGPALGITSVPTFVINQQWAVAGAQPVPAFVQALRQIAAETGLQPAQPAGSGCNADGCSL